MNAVAGSFDAFGRSSVSGSIASLERAEQAKVEMLLGRPSPDQV